MKPSHKSAITRRMFLSLAGRIAAGSLLTVGALGGYAFWIEPYCIELNYQYVNLPHLDSQFKGFRMVHISDIHLSSRYNGIQLEKIVDLILDQKPDLVVITGDYITQNNVDLLPQLENPLTRLARHQLTLTSFGNHDHWVDTTQVRKLLARSGIIELANQVTTIKQGSARLHIAGVDDPYTGNDDINRVLRHMPVDGAAILLVHTPDFADTSAETRRFDLQLSGHSHGGQVVLPFLGPPIIPFMANRYPSGVYKVGDMIQYTNRGLGTIYPHIRINCRPEITVFVF